MLPIITERSMNDAQKNKFTFKFPVSADKKVIRKMVEDRFLVNVTSVYTTIVKGKTIRTGQRRIEVKKSPWKKAIVTLKEGQKIGIFDTSEK